MIAYPQSNSTFRVLLADDHPVVLDGLAAVLAQEGFEVVGLACSGRQAVEQILSLRPDLAIIDLRMPDLNGIECIQEILANWPQAKVAVLTTFDQPEEIRECMEAGARGYFVKDIGRSELVRSLLEICACEVCLKPAPAALPPEPGSRSLKLTSRQLDVLRLLTAGHANKNIAEELSITEGTVKLHVYKLFKKLGVRSRTEAMLKAQLQGLSTPHRAGAKPGV